MQLAARRELRGARGRAVGGSWCGALRACEQRDVVAAAARVVQQGAGVTSSRLEGGEQDNLCLEVGGGGGDDVKGAGLGAAEGNDRSGGR